MMEGKAYGLEQAQGSNAAGEVPTRTPRRRTTLAALRREVDQAHLMTEAELQGTIIRMAQARGWLVKPEQQGSQTRNSRVRTPQNYTAKGFPDLVLARDGEVMFLELKAQDGAMTPEQILWSLALPSNSGPIRYEVIRPSDLSRGRVDELLA